MASMRLFRIGAISAAVLIASACEDTRSTTLEPYGDLGFGTLLVRTATNLPRGFVNFPAAIVASANPAADSVIVTLSGLDSLTTGTYTVWFANDSATKFVRATALDIRTTRVDSTINAAGDPIFTPTVTNVTGVTGFRSGGPNRTFRVATSRATATGMLATDSLNVVLVSIEGATPGAAPGEVRSLWARRSQATANNAGIRFGTFAPRVPLAANAGSPTAGQEYVVATSSTAGVGSMTIVPRGRVEVRGKILIANDSNYLRPPVGYYYNLFAIKLDTTGRFNGTVYLGRRQTPYPLRISLYEADKTNPAPDFVFDTPRVIFAMGTRVSTDTIAAANTTPAWLNYGFVRVNLQAKASQEGVMGPNTVLEATLPKSVRGR